jgi:signal transduction histidine kinase
MFAVAVALLGLIALLATLQYRWLGRISDAERERMRSTLNTRASGFAQDFDSELTRAYLLFQVEPSQTGDNVAEQVAARYDRWQATARYPRLIKDVYLVAGEQDRSPGLQRFNTGTRFLEPVAWPASLEPVRVHLAASRDLPAHTGALVFRAMPSPVWDDVPALVIPTPLIFFNQHQRESDVRIRPSMSYAVLLLDRDYVTGEMLPALAQQHFRQTGDGFDYQVAVVSTVRSTVVYQSTSAFSPKPDAKVDASVALFQVRMEDFASIASEVRRFTSTPATGTPHGGGGSSTTFREQIILPPLATRARGRGTFTVRESGPLSIIVQQNGTLNGAGMSAEARSVTMVSGAMWRLLVKHPSGSLESAVHSARRRNLIISSSILAVLGASVGLLVLSTRRAQELARQQMEFVAAVSHELRTPLAVIRSAGENLADGVVHDEEQVRKYGDLVRNEGRRLTEMVEQILDFAGIESGQLGFALRPVAIAPMLHEIVDSSRSLIDGARIQVQYAIADRLPPVLGEEAALRRVFQNLIANAIKYGEGGGWIGIRARQAEREVHVTIADRGIGIAPAQQPRIFEPFYRTPDVIAARIQGAGLGLSLVKRIVEAHGGRVDVRSAPGSGSEFTVVLPAASEEPVGRAAMSEAHGHGSHA